MIPNYQYLHIMEFMFMRNLISNCDWINSVPNRKNEYSEYLVFPLKDVTLWDRSCLLFSADMSRSRLDSCETKFGNCATSRSAGAMIWMNCQKNPKIRTKKAQIDLTDLTLLFHRRSHGVVPHTHAIIKTRRGRRKMKTATPLHAGIVDVLCWALFIFPLWLLFWWTYSIFTFRLHNA